MRPPSPLHGAQRLAEGVERAGADVAEDDAERADGENEEPRPAAGTPVRACGLGGVGLIDGWLGGSLDSQFIPSGTPA